MKSHWYAKVFGWGLLGLQVAAQATQGGLPHGFAGWTQLAGSLLAAIGIHAASNTDGTK